MSPHEIDPDGMPAAGGPEAAGGALDFSALLAAARRYYWILFVTSAVALGGGLAYLKTAEPVYQSSGEIKVERRSDRDERTEPGEAVSLFENASADDLKTIERVFLRPALIDRVIDSLKLETRDDFVASGRPASGVTRGELAAYIGRKASVALIPETRLIRVSFESWSPALAGEVAQALITQGIEYYQNQRTEAVNHNIKSLVEETRRLEENLIAAEKKRNDYLRDAGSVSVDQELNLVALQLREINSSLSALKAERLKLESDFGQVEASRGDADKLILIRSVRDMPSILALTSRANDLRGNFARVQERYGTLHPFKRQAESELKMVEQALREAILKAPESLEAALEIARRNEENLAREQQKLEGKVIQVKSQAAQFQVLQRQVDADRLSYEAALKRLNSERAQGRTQPVLIQAVGEPGYGYRTSLGPGRVLATSLVGGLMLGGGLLFLLAQSDKSFRSEEQIERALGLSVLASVPDHVAPAGAARGRLPVPVPVSEAPDSAAAEAFRMLTAFLQPDEGAGLGQAILITSAQAGEGKSFCALNLAAALAQSGQRTLLVDASLARPVLGGGFRGRRQARGSPSSCSGRFPSPVSWRRPLSRTSTW